MLSYGEFARMLYGTQIISDPWLAGEERFRLAPALLAEDRYGALCEAAERIGDLYQELTRIVLSRPELLDDFYRLTPWQKAMWLASEGRWHGIARVDLFSCSDGSIRSCEMNSDTPSGEAEAVLINRLLHDYSPGSIDPNRQFDERFWRMVCDSHRARTGGPEAPRAIGLIYPTDLPEDLSMIAIYREWLEARDCRVILGSPYNLGEDRDGRITVMGLPVDLILRHYKTDWWGEREIVWQNQSAYPDPDPLDRELSLLLPAETEGRVTVVNPFGAVLTQNKLSMALMWECQSFFSPQAREWIGRYIPETRRLTACAAEDLAREEWVLKSAYGCEGDSVVCGPFVKESDWRLALAVAIPSHWIAQRFFQVRPDEDGWLPNYGVYLMGGKAGGIYTRLSKQATDYTALTAPTFINARETLQQF